MKELLKAQKLARRNNENAAVFAAYERRRHRRGAGKKSGRASKRADDLDWQAAEREARPVRAVGFFLPSEAEAKADWP